MATQLLQRRAGLTSRACNRGSALRVQCVARPSCSKSSSNKQVSELSSPATAFSAVASIAVPLIAPLAASAASGEYGILEGRTAALLHPAFMFVLLGATVYSGYLGFQWRRTRELGEEIRSLKAAAASTATAEGGPAPNPEIEAKEKERKSLLSGNFKDKHHLWGSFLLAAGVGMSIEGAANTYMRTGKLFPGPHLFAGAFITALWALAAAQVPAMQKGDNNARNLHIALNSLQVLLFLWQVPTGLEIVGKVFEFTSWP